MPELLSGHLGKQILMDRIAAIAEFEHKVLGRALCRRKGEVPLLRPRDVSHSNDFAPQACLVFLVGAAGFEPTTPSPPDWCANRAAPRPDRNGADYRAALA